MVMSQTENIINNIRRKLNQDTKMCLYVQYVTLIFVNSLRYSL